MFLQVTLSKYFSAEVTKRLQEFCRVRYRRNSIVRILSCRVRFYYQMQFADKNFCTIDILLCFNLLELCQPGYFSASGFDSFTEPCEPCPVGTYSYLSGTKQCLPCPDNSSTKSTGATSSDDCFGKCLIFQRFCYIESLYLLTHFSRIFHFYTL